MMRLGLFFIRPRFLGYADHLDVAEAFSELKLGITNAALSERELLSFIFGAGFDPNGCPFDHRLR